jgi:hypothetical protein
MLVSHSRRGGGGGGCVERSGRGLFHVERRVMFRGLWMGNVWLVKRGGSLGLSKSWKRLGSISNHLDIVLLAKDSRSLLLE